MASQHVSLPYPTLDQGTDSFLHLARYAMGAETLAKGDLAAHTWIATGYALSKVFPPSAAMEAIELSAEVKAQLTQAHDDYQAGKINWSSLLQTILTLLIGFLPKQGDPT